MAVLPHSDIRQNTIKSFRNALKEHGTVFGFKHDGSVQFVVSKEHTRHVLTDEDTFSIEHGLAKLLNFQPLLRIYGSLFKDVDRIITEFFTRRLNIVVKQPYKVAPVFTKRASMLVKDEGGQTIHFSHHAELTLCEALILLTLGEAFITEQNCNTVGAIIKDIAELTDTSAQDPTKLSTTPRFARMATWFSIACYRLLMKLGGGLGSSVWRAISLALTSVILLFLAGWLIRFSADYQKVKFRQTGGECRIWGKKANKIGASYQTADGKLCHSLLLCSGWWGLARHANYTGSVMYTLALCAACGRGGIFHYTEAIIVGGLVIHRCYRDELKCAAKYGKDWDEYCRQVRWRMIPGIY